MTVDKLQLFLAAHFLDLHFAFGRFGTIRLFFAKAYGFGARKAEKTRAIASFLMVGKAAV